MVCCSPLLLKSWLCPSFPNSVFSDITLGAWSQLWWEYWHHVNATCQGSSFSSLRVNLPGSWAGTPDLKIAWGSGPREQAVRRGEKSMSSGRGDLAFLKGRPWERIKNVESQPLHPVILGWLFCGVKISACLSTTWSRCKLKLEN